MGLAWGQPRAFPALAIAERTGPARDEPVYAIRHLHRWPLGTPYTRIVSDVAELVNAPPLALPAQPYMEHAQEIWAELGLPALTPQPPWHGYSLGDWSEHWDIYAARAVAGKWEESGRETFARRRGGLTPETPVREVERKGQADGNK